MSLVRPVRVLGALSLAFAATLTTLAGVVDVTPAAAAVGVPAEPTGVSWTANVTNIVVSFTAPADNGSDPILGYTVEAHDLSTGTTSTEPPCATTTCTLTGLSDGDTFNFTVTAFNDVGQGPTSPTSSSVVAFDELVPFGCTSDYFVAEGGQLIHSTDLSSWAPLGAPITALNAIGTYEGVVVGIKPEGARVPPHVVLVDADGNEVDLGAFVGLPSGRYIAGATDGILEQYYVSTKHALYFVNPANSTATPISLPASITFHSDFVSVLGFLVQMKGGSIEASNGSENERFNVPRHDRGVPAGEFWAGSSSQPSFDWVRASDGAIFQADVMASTPTVTRVGSMPTAGTVSLPNDAASCIFGW
jgi:hypothetical protein